MRKQAGILKHIADAALLGGQIDPCLRIKQGQAVEHNRAALGGEKTRQHMRKGGFTRSRRAKQSKRRDIGVQQKFKIKFTALIGDIERQKGHGVAFLCRFKRRISSSESTSATTEMAMEMPASARAGASPSGIWV